MNKSENREPNIYEYLDFRTFMLDMVNYRISVNHKLSYRAFSKLAGYKSPAYFKAVIDGKRNLTPKTSKRVAIALGLRAEEIKFFDNLVNFEQSTEGTERLKYAREIHHFRAFRRRFPLEAAEFDYLSQWFYVVIRELTNLDDFTDNPQWIAEKLIPHISISDAKRALEVLIENKLIARSSDGRFIPSDRIVHATNKVNRTGLIHLHHSMIEHGNRSLERFRSDERVIRAITIAVSQKKLEVIQEMISEFQDKIMTEARLSDSFDRIYQLNVQFFPFTKK